jgi:hypothetical protein
MITIIAIGSTVIGMTPLHGHLRERIKREEETIDASQGREKEIPIITEEMIATAVITGRGVTRETTREGDGKKRRESKREGDSLRLIGTRGVCMPGRRMIMMLIKENCNSSLKNKLLAEIDNNLTQKGILRFLQKKSKNTQP